MSDGNSFVLGWGAAATIMFALWLWQVRTRNASSVDVAWAFCTALAAVFAMFVSAAPNTERKWLLIGMISIWGVRLGLHLLRRVRSEAEDGRYHHMRQSSGRFAQPVMFLMFQIQALWALLFALPVWAAAHNPALELRWTDGIGVLIWILAMGGEAIADRQLHLFRARPENRGYVCRDGLWRYSRHPNYFFEWLHWWAYVFIGIGSPYWWVTLASVAVMYLFLTRITGIPFTEQQAARSRGKAYEEYQRTTSRFFPLPPHRHERPAS